MVSMALDAADDLAAQGIRAAVLDMFTWKPLDEDAVLQYAEKTGAFVTAENHNTLCGLGAAIADATAKLHPVPVEKVGVNDSFGEVGDEAYLRERFDLTKDAIIRAAKRAIGRKG
jgi:transketolase